MVGGGYVACSMMSTWSYGEVWGIVPTWHKDMRGYIGLMAW